MQPTRDIVLIKVDPPKERTASGIYLKEEWKTLPPTGTVMAVGPKVKTVKRGHRVIFERYAALILANDERLCKEDHILAIIEPESAEAYDGYSSNG